MNRYEMIYIIDTGLEEAARKELIEKVSALIANNGGEIEKVDETWGKRRLAYAIDYKTEGWYVLVNFKAPAELPRELERNLQINENVLRYLVVKLEEKRSAVKPRAARPAPVEEAPAEEAPVAEEAPAEAEPVAEVAPAMEAAPDTDAE
ncbi:MAG: 30S ribosomal protein S6 [Clostridia bacterium]|nr:30S ribosomal protein S6 [Clostridia bacterium]